MSVPANVMRVQKMSLHVVLAMMLAAVTLAHVELD